MLVCNVSQLFVSMLQMQEGISRDVAQLTAGTQEDVLLMTFFVSRLTDIVGLLGCEWAVDTM